MKFNDVMIDIETLATSDRAAVLSIGVCAFDAGEGGIEDGIHWAMAVGPQHMREINADTVRWWMEQDVAQRERAFLGTAHPTWVLDRLAEYFDAHVEKKAQVWANGPQFDLVILRSLARDFDRIVPWHYRQERDFRTIRALAPIDTKLPRKTDAHDALADAIWQAEAVKAFYKAITQS